MRVVKWISYEEADGLEPAVGDMGGWFKNGHRWEDFIEEFTDGAHPYFEAIRDEVVRMNLRRGGDWHQKDPHGVPVFEDGRVATFSYRAWGDMLAAIWSDNDQKDYTYMSFYMDTLVAEQPDQLN